MQYPSHVTIASACDVALFPLAPQSGVRDYDTYRLRSDATARICVQVTLTVLNQTVADYAVQANSPQFVHDQIDAGWRGDAGYSTNIPPEVRTFSVAFDPGEAFEVVVENMNATGSGQAYELILSNETCALSGIFADGFE
jgi:hypothetical protein